jgi:hypothetical protein
MTAKNDSTNISTATPAEKHADENATSAAVSSSAAVLDSDYFSQEAFPNADAMNKVLARLGSIEAIATAMNRDVLAAERLDSHEPFTSRVMHGLLTAIEDLAFSAAVTAESFGESLAVMHRQSAARGSK